MFSIMGPVSTREALDPLEKVSGSSFKSSPLNSYIEIYSSNEADKAARDFAASIASAYRPSTRKIIILDRKYEISLLDRLLK
jgi:hypothetical protein